jgi:hypothetical protein
MALLATHFVEDHIEGALFGLHSSMYSVVAPQELLLTVSSMVFYTDAQGLLFIGLGRSVLAIRYRVRLLFLLRNLLLCL